QTQLSHKLRSVYGKTISEFGEASISALCCRDIAVSPFVTSNFARPFHERHSASCLSPLQKLCQPLRPTEAGKASAMAIGMMLNAAREKVLRNSKSQKD